MTKQEDQGKIGEEALNKWLSDSRLPYVSICQSRETFSQLFSKNAKRPDFFLLIQSIGLIAIDAKNQKFYEGHQNYTLNYDNELRRALMFESLFRIPLWYAYYDESENQWYWISALKALEKGDLRQQNGDKGESFLAIKREHFVTIKTADELSKLYMHRINDMKRLSKTMPFEAKSRLYTRKSKTDTVSSINNESNPKTPPIIVTRNDVLEGKRPSLRHLLKSVTRWF